MSEQLLNDKSYQQLFEAMLTLKSVPELKKFFRDLCTRTELKALAERWQVVQLLQAEVPYREISKQTGASTATITRVAQWLNHGEGGYQLVLNRQKKAVRKGK